MNTIPQTSEETAALALLKSTKLPLLEAAQVACAAVRAGRGRVKRALRCIAAGEEELKRQERTVTFDKAVAAALEARQHRRARTLCDFRYVTRRFMKRCPGLARRRVFHICQYNRLLPGYLFPQRVLLPEDRKPHFAKVNTLRFVQEKHFFYSVMPAGRGSNKSQQASAHKQETSTATGRDKMNGRRHTGRSNPL